jgi:hypothetical protein
MLAGQPVAEHPTGAARYAPHRGGVTPFGGSSNPLLLDEAFGFAQGGPRDGCWVSACQQLIINLL